MNQQPKVNVILATYNGAKHIRQQLDSILNQTYENYTVCIRDDGSSDETLDIIKGYQRNHSNIRLIKSKTNLGVPNSFYEILRVCDDAEYYAFADQDDYWLPEKLARAIEKLEEQKEANKPLLYCCSYDYYTDDGMFIRNFKLTDSFDIHKSIYYTAASGFVIVFNEQLKEKALKGTEYLKREEFGELHDRRFIRVAYLFGQLIFDDYVGARHIRHSDAVTAADSTNINLLKNWYKNEVHGQDMVEQREGVRTFKDEYKNDLSDEQRKVFDIFCSDGKRIRKTFYPHRLRERISGELLLRVLFLIGKV